MSSVSLTHDWAATTWDWPLQHNDGVVKVQNTANAFEVGLDCQFFTPNEIEVKVSGQELLINCRHERKEIPHPKSKIFRRRNVLFSEIPIDTMLRTDSHGTVARQIQRAYKLPEDVDVGTIKSNLDSRGVLLITASKKK